MPKSGRHTPARAGQRRQRSGDPRRRAAQAAAQAVRDPAEQARTRLLDLLAFGDTTDPLLSIKVPALFLDWMVFEQGEGFPEERCLTDCVILACSYAHLGIAAHIRAAELTVTDTRDRITTTHGSLNPWWEDGLMHGHGVVWIPEHRCLIDPTIFQFLPWDTQRNPGPVITTALRDGRDADSISCSHDRFRISYTLAPAEATAPLLSHPVMRDEHAGCLRRGMNVASAALALMADHLPPERARVIPHPRTAAQVTAIQGLGIQHTPEDDWGFRVPGHSEDSALVSLAELPLPAGTPPAQPMP